MLGPLISLLIALVVIFVVAWLAHYLISTFFPPAIHQPAMVVIGLLLLLVLLYVVLGHYNIEWRGLR